MTVTPRILPLIAAALLAPALSHAQFKNQGYLLDQNSNIVTSANTGLCWRTGDWTPARAVAQCDPDLVKKPEAAPKKAEAAPAPAPAPAPAAPKKAEAAAVASLK